MGGNKNDKVKRQQARARKRSSHANKPKKRTVVKTVAAPEQLQLISKPTEFKSFAETCAFVKQNVYIIARLRGNQVITLGTGFLVGVGRLMTCAHVINSDDETKHVEGDKYLLMHVNEFGAWHRAIIEPEIDKSLHIYPSIDTAILDLPDTFYEVDGQVIRLREQYLSLSSHPLPIGTDVGVLGYPMQEIRFNDDGLPITGDVRLRADKGVINSGYVHEGVAMNEFTMAFNPGNSGGPIFDAETGDVIAMVHAYNSIPLQFVKEDVPEHLQEVVGSPIVRSSIRALYSLGICSVNMLALKDKHQITFS